MTIVIVEDESAAARNLEAVLRNVAPEMICVATLESVAESVDYFRNNKMPELIFMDIHLADGESFRIFESVEITAPIIFTTAYDQYALKAFEVNSIDYILKPISEECVHRAISKLGRLSKIEVAEQNQRVASVANSAIAARPTTLLAHVKDRIVPVELRDVAFFYTTQDRVRATMLNGVSFPLDKSLEHISELLNDDEFYRANRQFIIARSAVKDISVWFGSRLCVNLNVESPEKIIISKARVSKFKRWIQSLHTLN